jgi:uncharacterized peroxidase-related enzyme
MRLRSYELGARRGQRAFVRLTRALGAELDDVGKAALRRPGFFGRPFLCFAQALLRGPSSWSVGERELLATAVSRANSCGFCVGTHGEIAAKELHCDAESVARGREGGPRVSAAAAFVEALSRDPESLSRAEVERAYAAGADDDALAEAIYIALFFNTMNRVADALGFEHRSDRDRRRGAEILRRGGYRLPGFLLRD